MNVFLDTNVIIDFMGECEGFFDMLLPSLP